MRCDTCPVAAGATCRGESETFLCTLAASKPKYAALLTRPATDDGEADFPPLVEQAANLAGAVGRFLASGMERTTPEERERRLAICRSNECGRFVDGRCAECGCQLRIKISMSSEHCPIGKW